MAAEGRFFVAWKSRHIKNDIKLKLLCADFFSKTRKDGTYDD